jgi:hypothetical protein
MRTLVLAACALLPAPGLADPTNRNLIPFGERAAMLGNAGITSPFGEAVFYNPANLQRVGHANLSVSGSTYLLYQLAVDPLFVLDGEDQRFEASGFVAIPSTVVSTYQLGRLAIANAILVPEALAFKNRATFETATTRVTVLREAQQTQLWLGGGAALEVADGVFVGLSVFVARTTESELDFSRVVNRTDPAVLDVIEQTTSSDVTVLGASAIAGVQIQRGRLGIGARIHSPTVRLTGEGDAYGARTHLSAAMPESEEQALEDVQVDRPLPLDAGVGISLQATPRLSLLFDINVQLPATLVRVDDPRFARVEQAVALAPRGSFGVEWELATHKWLRAGAMINRSASASPNSAADETREDYAGATLGFAWRSGRTQTALGVFYLHGAVETFVQNIDPPRRADATARMYGGLFTVSYRL